MSTAPTQKNQLMSSWTEVFHGTSSCGTVGMPFCPFSRTLPMTYWSPEVARMPFSRISVKTRVMTLR